MATPYHFTLHDGVDETHIALTDDAFDGWSVNENELVFLLDQWWCVDEIRHIPRKGFAPYTIQFMCFRYEPDEHVIPSDLDTEETF